MYLLERYPDYLGAVQYLDGFILNSCSVIWYFKQ